MNRGIRIHETGGPDVLRWEEVDDPTPGVGEVTIRHSPVGLNFIGTVKIEIGQRYALEDTRRAHEDLEARNTTGSTVLVP